MFTWHYLKRSVVSLFIFLSLVSFSTFVFADQEGLSSLDIRAFVAEPNFIFRGRVLSVAYRDAEMVPEIDPATSVQALEDGEPVFQDGSGMAHTFVTYFIEHVYKGSRPQAPGGPPLDEITLRHIGGQLQADTQIIEWVDIFPLFDPNDRGILFVSGNTVHPFPLHQNRNGRLRIINGLIYSDYGQRVLHIQNPTPIPEEAEFGPTDNLPEIHINQIGSATLGREIVPAVNEHGPGGQPPEPNSLEPPTVHFSEVSFHGFLTQIVTEVYPTGPPSLPPVASANILDPINPEPLVPKGFLPVAPEPTVPVRGWFDNLSDAEKDEVLEEDRVEAALMDLTGGDPVVPDPNSPDYECEIEILQFGVLAGDISGPDGHSDCFINLLDAAQMAAHWLLCYDPNDPTCVILDL